MAPTSTPTPTTNTFKFELPVLAPLASLTDGTSIPPPPDSPPLTAVRPAAAPKPDLAPLTTPDPTPAPAAPPVDSGLLSPISPTSPQRPSSVRRFLSRRSLNGSYKAGNGSVESLAAPRPESSLSMAKGGKRGGSWWRRFVGESDEGRRKRTSVVFEERPKQVMGPPPPKLPELKVGEGRGEEGLGGEDLFRNIR